MKLFFRALFLALLRFVAMLALLTSIMYLDTSPLPEAPTYLALSYLIHFGATWIFTAWVFAHREPSWGQGVWVFALFTVVSLALEMALQSWITGQGYFTSFRNLNWQSVLVLFTQAAGALVATWRARKSWRV